MSPSAPLVLVVVAIVSVFLLPLVGVLLNRPKPKDDIHAPRRVDYLSSMKTLDSAETCLERIEGGGLELTIRHEVIEDVTPAMLVWWFRNFPARTTEVGGEEVPWYQLWHPVDHVEVRIRGEDGVEAPGMFVGAEVDIDEQLGPDYAVMGGGFTVEKLDESGIVLVMERFGVRVVRLEHRFEEVGDGTLYESMLRVGTSVPVVKYYVNFLLTRFVFTGDVGRAWLQHNVEEVGNFQFFLPDLYAEHAPE